ncbi:MAG: bifunctional (p)ppGpp synthetase/guanosine-3',5'-bis(diphosphate) 3'-pyrophosphohydrolase [Candidatus Pacebacteria bacterium]|nr:bifunctional (p)ppGpp synthetase/guanosine-3',5'-bis(diphosphate) 3'-pyrophosphohydrolase [Candidatus Paceibacterota bacterium]
MVTAKEIIEAMSAPPSNEEKALVERAYVFAADAHKEQKRFSGEPYMEHLSRVAKSLADIGMGPKTISAGLLHDTIEDTGVAPETIERDFGKEILFLVEGVTKLGHLKYRGTERHRESLRKLLVATSKDTRVLIIKLMDRLHNMRTLQYVKPEKQKRIALETLEIYAAIAHRLGMGVVRKELEDLAFQYAYPEEYANAKRLLTEKTKETQERLEDMLRMLKKELAKENITHFQTDFRVKGLWSLWQKLKRKEGDVSKVHDIAAIRIVVEDVANCYRVLGLVHNLWQPLVGKIKDYIAFPKPNGYQSLHTTVFSGDGGIVEVQIRTKDMHREAMYGIAAHVTYKEQAGAASGRGSSFDWIRSLIPSFGRRKEVATPEGKEKPRYGSANAPEWLQNLSEHETEDPDFDTVLKTDLFTHRVFVFTPHGDVVDLPTQASPIDFAYAIHSELGDHVFGAKVNGKMVPLHTVLHNGDIVEIETRKSSRPTQKWLDFAKTTMARRHIRNSLEEQEKNKS